MPRLTPARIRKALAHRLRKLRNTATANSGVRVQDFATLAALREHALTTANIGNRFAYSVAVDKGDFPAGLQLRLGRVTSAEVSLRNGRLLADIMLNTTVSEGEVAWAVAAMAQPSLRPVAQCGRDVAVEAPLDPALAMGHRLVFGGFGEKDASAMESENARRVTSADTQVPYFDLATFNPMGLRLREQADSLAVVDVDLNTTNAATLIASKSLAFNLTGGTASEVAGLAATGRLLHCANPPAGLNPELASMISQPLPSVAKDHAALIDVLLRSEQQRRLAMIHHAGAWRLQAEWPLASVLLVTNRAGMLPNALAQIAAQTYPNFEVLVGLHNIPDAAAELAAAKQVLGDRLRVFQFNDEHNLGAIYGELTARADGVYLAKFDDDDYYGSHHLWDAIISMRYSGAGLFGRTPTITWLDATGELLFRPFGSEECYGRYIIGATMVVQKAALIEAGGWRPSPWAVDKALIDRFTQAGAGIYRAGQLGWVYVRHNQGHTWLRDEAHFRGQAEAVWEGDTAIALRDRVLGR